MNQSLVVPPPAISSEIKQKIPINVFTGFLGSGKTTVIANLVNQIKDQEKLIFIKNEQGDIDLDSRILAQQKIVSQELLNGCVCCTLVGPLLETIDELIEQYHPDRILLESSGTAEPINLAVTLNGSQSVYRDGLVAIIDALNFNQEPNYNDHYQLQAKMTDLLVVNKIELIDESQKQKLLESLRQINSHSPIVTAVNGKIDASLMLGFPTTQINLTQIPHLHTHEIESITIDLPEVVNLSQIEVVLDNLPDEIIRTKGIVLTPETVIINQAYKRRSLTKPMDGSVPIKGFLYFIGKHIQQYQDEIKQKLEQATAK